jgi:hypothetical protein
MKLVTPPSKSWRDSDCHSSVYEDLWNMQFFFYFFHGAIAPKGAGPHYRGFTTTLRNTTLARSPLGDWSALRRDFYLTTHNTYKTQTSMHPAGFESPIPTSEWTHPHALNRAATGIGEWFHICWHIVTDIFSVREIQGDFDRKGVDSSLLWNVGNC